MNKKETIEEVLASVMFVLALVTIFAVGALLLS